MASIQTGNGFVMLTNSENGLALAKPFRNSVLPDTHRVFKFHMLHDGFGNFLRKTLHICL